MDSGRGSVTSIVTAYSRAYHSKYEEPKIFDDYLAFELFSQEEWEYLTYNLAESLKFFDPEFATDCTDRMKAVDRVMKTQNSAVTLSRSRYTEDSLEEAISSGIRQYVILGAGLDTYAFRRKDALDRLHIFEVDHPDSQADKLARIGREGFGIHQNLHFIPLDLTKDDLKSALVNSGYDCGVLSFISWLGVICYLDASAVYETLHSLARMAPSGSIIVFDYFEKAAFDPEKAGKRMQLTQEIVRKAGEPMKFGFDPSSLASELAGKGLKLLEDIGPLEIKERYFSGRSDGYLANDYVHFVKALVL